jgi:hypothetical protein
MTAKKNIDTTLLDRKTYNIVFRNIKVTERIGKAKATLVCLLPCEMDSFVHNWEAIAINFGSSTQEIYGSERNIICITLWKLIHRRKSWRSQLALCRKKDRVLVEGINRESRPQLERLGPTNNIETIG